MLYSLSWLLVDIITNEDKMYLFHVSNWTEIVQCIYFGYSFVTAIASVVTTNEVSENENDKNCYDKNKKISKANQ